MIVAAETGLMSTLLNPYVLFFGMLFLGPALDCWASAWAQVRRTEERNRTAERLASQGMTADEIERLIGPAPTA